MCARCQQLQDRVAELETVLGMHEKLPDIGLAPPEYQLLGMILKRTTLTREGAFAALYGARVGRQPEIKILDCYVSKIRARLPDGIEIETLWGIGWSMPADAKAAARAWLVEQGWQP